MGPGTVRALQAGRVARVLLSPPFPGAHVEWERWRRICVQGTSGAGGSGRKTAWVGLYLTCGMAQPGELQAWRWEGAKCKPAQEQEWG